MNFIFDIGNVLAVFDPVGYMNDLFSDKSLINEMDKLIFKSKEWVFMDEGRLTHTEAADIFIKRDLKNQATIRTIMQNLDKILPPINETIDLLPRVKSSGHNLYYLSNMHKEFVELLLNNNDYFKLFSGGIFSCDVNMVKPSPGIYHCLINKYQLEPDDCIFFDDVEENVSAAEKEGIKSILFTTADCVLDYL